MGAALVVVHGETIVEPVAEGTNRAAIEAGADVLAHPGLISTEDVLLAKERAVALEITSRAGHSLSNGHVAQMAIRFGAPLVVCTDAHGPGDLISQEMAQKVLLSAGIEPARLESIFQTAQGILREALRRSNA